MIDLRFLVLLSKEKIYLKNLIQITFSNKNALYIHKYEQHK